MAIARAAAITVWELPQTLLGALLALALLTTGTLKGHSVEQGRLFCYTGGVSVSLGLFLFCRAGSRRIKQHEYGHALQSLRLGPLYLAAVGLPSVLRNLYGRLHRRLRGTPWSGYYEGYPENWADRLSRSADVELK